MPCPGAHPPSFEGTGTVNKLIVVALAGVLLIKVAKVQLIQRRDPPGQFQGWAKVKVRDKWRWVLTARFSPWNLPPALAGQPC